MPKVSIIMGVYNCKNKVLLRKSIQSIIDQTFIDWEFLICNDGSKDDTLVALQEAASLDERIRILSYDKNEGLCHALNICIAEAKGELIARQDDDDISYPNRLMQQIEFMNKNREYAMCGTLADVFNENEIWGEYCVEEIPKKNSFLWNSPFIHPTIMIRKEILVLMSGYRESKETRRCEDYDLFMRLYARGFRGYNIQKKLYCYYMENSKTIIYRTMKYRIDEAKVRFIGYNALGILFPKGILFVIKPILIGLIPQRILYIIKQRQY